MNIKNQIEIHMNDIDIKNAVIHYLYSKKNISGIFNVKFNFVKELDKCILDSATIIVDTNNEINRTNL